MFKANKKIKSNLVIETLSFLNQKLDMILGKSELINELLEEVDDPIIIQKLEVKLSGLERELDHIGNKIDLENKFLKNSQKLL